MTSRDHYRQQYTYIWICSTGWLKIKCPIRLNAIYQQSMEIFWGRFSNLEQEAQLPLRNRSSEMQFKTSVNARPHALSSNVFFLILPETIVPAEDLCRWQYISIFISLYAIIFRKSHGRSRAAKPARKQNLTRNSHSRSFNVMYFGVSWKATRGQILYILCWPHFLRCRRRIAPESPENQRFRLRTVVWRPLSREFPRISA